MKTALAIVTIALSVAPLGLAVLIAGLCLVVSTAGRGYVDNFVGDDSGKQPAGGEK